MPEPIVLLIRDTALRDLCRAELNGHPVAVAESASELPRDAALCIGDCAEHPRGLGFVRCPAAHSGGQPLCAASVRPRGEYLAVQTAERLNFVRMGDHVHGGYLLRALLFGQ